MLILALLADTAEVEDRTIEGWTVKVYRDVGPDAVRLLETRLQDIVRLVPRRPLEELRKVPIWIGGREGKGIAQYHPSRSWSSTSWPTPTTTASSASATRGSAPPTTPR